MNTLQELAEHLAAARDLIEKLRSGEQGKFLQDFAEATEFDSIEECENIIDDFIN